MIELAARSLRIFGLRLVRSVGYSGRHPGVVSVVAVAVILALDLAVSELGRQQLAQLVGPRPSTGGLLAAAIVIAVFFMAGPIMLLTESIRGRGSRIQAVLSSLPLTMREIGIVTWLPGFAAASILLLLLLLPAVSAFVGLGMGIVPSFEAAAASILAGCGMAAVVIVFIRLVMPAARWADAQFPTMWLLWVAVYGLESWQSGLVIQNASLSPWQYLLLCPWLVGTVIHHPEGLGVVLGISATLSVGAVLLLPWSALASGVVRLRPVLWTWNRSRSPAMVTVELTRFLRSGEVLANLIGAEVIALGLAVALLKVPVEFRSQLAPVLLAMICSVVAVPLAMLRGRTRVALPMPLQLGIGPVKWASAQLLAGVAIFVGVLLAPMLVLVVLGVAGWTVLTIGIPFAVAFAGVALAVGWLIPATADNPLGQVGDTVLLLLVMSVIGIAAEHWLTTGTAIWSVAMVSAGLVGSAVAISTERRRWTRRLARPSRSAG